MQPLARLLAAECRQQRSRLLVAAGCAALAAAASVLLLGLSGWFITAASAAGLAGAAAASAFNALLPGAAIRLLAILRTSCRYTERLVGHDAALRVMGRVRPAVFRALAASPPGAALALSVGDATARVVDDAAAIETALVQRPAAWAAAAAALAGCGLSLTAGLAPALALAAILTATMLAAASLALRLDAHARAIPAAQGALRHEVAAVLSATAELRAYGLEAWAAERVADRSAALLRLQHRANEAAGGFELLLAAAAGVAAVAALLLARHAGVPPAAMAALAAAASVEGLGGALRTLQHRARLQAAERRIGELMRPAHTPAFAAIPAGIAIGLPGISRPLAPGTIAGIAGASGCGKTTLLETLVALREAAPGAIHIGGADLAALHPAFIRALFALAPQDSGLLAGTVRDNLLLAAPTATGDTLWDALHDAGLDSRIRALPQGLDTWIGENGMRLSGGERRRLVLARAMLRHAPWLLLDEPTEGLDAATEALVMHRLQARLARHNQGAIIVSHRPAPLAICQRLLTITAPATLTEPQPRATSVSWPIPASHAAQAVGRAIWHRQSAPAA